jgi:antitoxin component of MazEF toxin-antitoxin module
MADVTETEARLTRHGNSTGLVLAREVLDAAGMERGDGVLIRAEPGKVTIEKADTVHSRAMAAYREFAARYKVALRALAK